MSEKVEVNKSNLNNLFFTVKCLTSQIEEEHRTREAVKKFWTKKYLFYKKAILECNDINELHFIQRKIASNELTEEILSTYKRRKKVKKCK